MRTTGIFISLCFMFLILAGEFLLASDPYEGKRITGIEFKGLTHSDELSVKSVISSKVRSGYSQNVIDEDIKALYNLNIFEDIKVDVTEKDDGVFVTFLFVELPTINEIIIKGRKRVSEGAIKGEILFKKGSVYNESDVYSDIQKIVELYEERGFPDTKVEWSIKESKEKDKKTGEKKNSVDLIFSVKESRKLVIRSLNFSGVSAVDIDKLSRLMKTKQRGYLFSRGFYQEDEFELDKGEIIRYYGNNGYIDADVIKIDRSIQKNEEKNREEMDITIYIKEGKQFTFGGVNISGNKIFTDEELYSLITMKEKSIFNEKQWESNVQLIRNLLAENGYIYHTIDIYENKDNENLVISYSINITENNKAHVEHIFVTGNDKTKKFVIEREIEIKEGEIYNVKEIQRSMEKLTNLQYFSAINFDVKPGSEFGLVDLIFDVEEQKTGMFSLGMSWSTAGYGMSLFEEVSANNFLGRGLKLHEKVDVGLTRQAIEVGIDEPWLLGTPTSAGFTISWARTEYGSRSGDDIYTYNEGQILPNTDIEVPDGVIWTDNGDGTYTYDYENANMMDYVNMSYKVALRLGRRFGKFYGIGSEIAFSVFRNFSDVDDVPFEDSLREQYYDNWPWNWKNYISFTAYRDTRDLTIFATKGNFISQNVMFFGGPLGGYSNFIKLNTDTNLNVKTFWKFVLSTRLNYGFIFPFFGKPLSIDDVDYLRIDSMNEGRGWQNPSQWGTIYSIRGRAELNFSLEHRFPIEERLVWGLTFFDASGIYSKPENLSINYKDLYYSFGFGVSFLIPGFPIRLYLARRFAYDESLEKLQFANSQKLFRTWDFVIAIAGFF